jgi:hypothetical protein
MVFSTIRRVDPCGLPLTAAARHLTLSRPCTLCSVYATQYEMYIPLSRIHTCYAALTEKLYGTEQRWRGFRAPGLLRFVKGETGLLSPTNGGVRAAINIEDYVRRRRHAAHVLAALHPDACSLAYV